MGCGMFLAQIESAGEVAKAAIEGATKYNSEVFLFVFVALLGAAIWAFNFWAVRIPDARAARKNHELLTQAISALTPLASETKELAENASNNTVELKEMMHKIIRNMRIKIEILKKISKVAKIDISDELSQMSGILMEDGK